MIHAQCKDPVADALPGAVAVAGPIQLRGAAVGYGGDASGPLRPVFVQHDRSRTAWAGVEGGGGWWGGGAFELTLHPVALKG